MSGEALPVNRLVSHLNPFKTLPQCISLNIKISRLNATLWTKNNILNEPRNLIYYFTNLEKKNIYIPCKYFAYH